MRKRYHFPNTVHLLSAVISEITLRGGKIRVKSKDLKYLITHCFDILHNSNSNSKHYVQLEAAELLRSKKKRKLRVKYHREEAVLLKETLIEL